MDRQQQQTESIVYYRKREGREKKRDGKNEREIEKEREEPNFRVKMTHTFVKAFIYKNLLKRDRSEQNQFENSCVDKQTQIRKIRNLIYQLTCAPNSRVTNNNFKR